MGKKKLKSRSEIDNKFKWNIEAMYRDESEWQRDVDQAVAMTDSFSSYQGRLSENAATLADAFEAKDSIWLKLERAYVYARMKMDEDNTVAKQQAMHDKMNTIIAKCSAAMSFFTPELLSSSEETLIRYIGEEPRLKKYEFVIRDILREQKHILPAEQENLMAQMSEVTGATNNIFTMLNDADIKFGIVTDDEGEEVQVTHGNYITFMESHNRSVRKAAYVNMYEAYKGLINTLASAYNFNVKTDVVTAKIRHFDSARQSALSGDNIPESVYDNLISVVHKHLPVLHRYTELRKKVLGVNELKMYDIYVPLIELPKKTVPYDEAISITKQGLTPLGEEYISRLSKGLEDGWIDVYENKGKTSGAYSFGSYDSFPYILLNYTDTLKDVFTVVHEMGHSMHSSYTRETQPFAYGGHSIFTAEVASTVNESLLMQHLLAKESDKDMKKYILNLYIEEFRTTLFRQTMFAEFEDLTHRYTEEGGSLTAEWLCGEYERLNREYFGPALAEDKYIKYEWSRIPHFYRGFYVYQYATGYSAATAISKKILAEGVPARDAYKEFLKTGSSDYPVELLKIAGVDMSSPEPIEMAMETFTKLVEELESLL